MERPNPVDATKSARVALRTAINGILERYNRQIGENGGRTEPFQFDENTGFWSVESSKPRRWLLHLAKNETGAWVASLPTGAPFAKRIVGGLNASREIHQGVSSRVLVAIRREVGTYELYLPFEWVLMFIFPDLPVSVSVKQATSGDTVDFDPATGNLSIKGTPQPYLCAYLFKVASDVPPYSVDLTYDVATAAILRFVNVHPNVRQGEEVP